MIVAYMPRLTRIQERSADGQLTGFAVDLTYNEDTGRLTQLDTSDGRSIAYTHDVVPPGLTSGNLLQVTGLGDLYHLYKYEDTNDAHNLTWIQKGLNATPVVNTYDSKDRVVQQVDGAALLTVSYVTARTRTDVTQKVFDDQGALLHTNTSRHYFDEAGYPTSEVNPAGHEFRRIYNANKDVERVELRSTYSGTIVKSATYTHDGQAHLLSQSVKLDAADGGEAITRTYAYDNNWLASEQIVSDAAPTKIFRTEYSFLRDGVNGPPMAIHEVKQRNDDGSFATTTYGYCSASDVSVPGSTCPYLRLLKEVDGPRTDVSDVTTYTYYPETDLSGCSSPPAGACHRKGQLWKTTNALGHVIENVRYDAAGRLSRQKDANNVVTDLEYDARNRLVVQKIRGSNDGVETDDAITLTAYDDRGNPTQVTQPDGSSLTLTYDARGRLTDIEDAMDNRIHYVLDSEGNRLREDTFDSADILWRTLSRSYTNLGQIQQLLNAQGIPSSFTYTAASMSDQATDALGRVTDNDYDDLDRLTKTVQDKRTGGLNATVKYSYDAAGNLRKVIDPGNLPTEYVYDALGNLVSLASPDTGTTNYLYDAAGNRTSQMDARGVATSYTYDQLNRLASISYPDTDLNIVYTYDQSDSVTGCTVSFPTGRITQMQDVSGTTTYCYDRHGNVTQKIHAPSMGPSRVTEYSYTLNDHMASVIYPSGAILTYTRDAVGRLQGAAWQENALATPTNLVANAEYAPFGALTLIAFGNGRTQTRTYDQDYAIDSITGTPAGALTLDFGVDAMGNIIEASDSLNPAAPERVYTYDALYRLTMAATGTTPPAPLEAYTYNATGDRLSASVNGNPADPYAYVPNTHRLARVGAAARTYDDNGNTLTGLLSGYTLTYDDRNRLHQATKPPTNTASFRYNGKGERVAKVFSNGIVGTFTAFAYDEGGKLLGEYDDAGNVLAEYVYLDDMPIAVIKDATPYYLEADHLGTPRQVIDPLTNTVLWKWELLESTFGTNAPNDDPDGDSAMFAMGLRLPGQYFDIETGLHYNYFRDYEPGTGRYVESDPIGLEGGITTYGYVGGRPLVTFDRRGLYGSWSEGNSCLSKYGWDACHFADKCGTAATNYAVGIRSNDLGVGDRQDGLRHCYLACCMAKKMGRKTASGILFDHELFSPPPPGRECERYQDFFNNEIGMGIADKGGDCKGCQNAPTLDEAKCPNEAVCR